MSGRHLENEVQETEFLIESAVGLFSFAVIAALFLLTVVLSQDSLFRAERPVEILFDDAMGLRVGDVVSARGVTVGKVKQIALKPDGVHVSAPAQDARAFAGRLPDRGDAHLGAGRALSEHRRRDLDAEPIAPAPAAGGGPSTT
jgi:hypothetical protein